MERDIDQRINYGKMKKKDLGEIRLHPRLDVYKGVEQA
jgi:hypothetical protein